MAPNSVSTVTDDKIEEQIIEKPAQKLQIVWFNVFLFIYLHGCAVYGIYLGATSAQLKTALFAYIYGSVGGLGITAGCHRLWCHRSYKAKWPLRVLLCIFASIAGQNDIFEWCRDHRVHHKFTETDADPHNIRRGFFFAHMGWLMCKKHPDVREKGKTVFLDDLLLDPIVRFHRKYYVAMLILFNFYLPTMIPVWCWGESVWNAYFIAAMTKYCGSLNFTWLVNSAAHKFGDKPFDKYIDARENWFVSAMAAGEGWHNYHHVFPWDYSTSELGYTLNTTKLFIDFMGVLGLAYDMKTASPDLIQRRKLKTGDGTRISDSELSKLNSKVL